MKQRCQAALTLVALAACVLHGVARGAPPREPQEPRGKAAAAGVLAPESGKFRILLDGQQVGAEDYQISRSGSGWLARGTSEIAAGGASGKVRGELRLSAEGAPLRYEWSSEGPKKNSAVITFQNGKATAELRLEGGKTFTQEFEFAPSSALVILDNNLYHHYAILARLYDWKAKGAQTFSVLIPQEMTPGTVTVESLGTQPGTPVELLRVRTPDLEIDLYLDAGRLVRLAVPAAKAEIIRQ